MFVNYAFIPLACQEQNIKEFGKSKGKVVFSYKARRILPHACIRDIFHGNYFIVIFTLFYCLYTRSYLFLYLISYLIFILFVHFILFSLYFIVLRQK